jgi:heme-degrading monooxygenase HmoA
MRHPIWVSLLLRQPSRRRRDFRKSQTPPAFISHIRKETPMTVKIIIKRAFKEGMQKEAIRALNMARYAAMEQNGYISSETLSDIGDPTRIAVVSMWRELDAWETWRNSDRRKAIEAEMEPLTKRPAEYEYYNLGISNP